MKRWKFVVPTTIFRIYKRTHTHTLIQVYYIILFDMYLAIYYIGVRVWIIRKIAADGWRWGKQSKRARH